MFKLLESSEYSGLSLSIYPLTILKLKKYKRFLVKSFIADIFKNTVISDDDFKNLNDDPNMQTTLKQRNLCLLVFYKCLVLVLYDSLVLVLTEYKSLPSVESPDSASGDGK